MKAYPEFDDQNRKFWNEICGSTFAEMNSIELKDLSQIKLFDELYFDFYPYLFKELNWVLEGAENCIEVGLGAGTVSRYLASNCKNYSGLDISDESCNFVQATFDFLQLKGKIVNRSILNDIDPNESEKYDSAVAIGSLHHSGDLNLALKNLELFVKPGGKILVMVYSYSQPKRILLNPLRYISNILNVLIKRRFYFEETNRIVRKASDKNLAGEPAPITTYSSRNLFLIRKEVNYKCSLKNSHKLGYKFLYIQRRFALKYFSPWIGTDIYARGIKLYK
jgi:SAM-dependent methyltransferase